ncbi:MAG: tRNA (adenosine(37)-N6)-dimethylallyltransferase MiaA, partial [Desulfatitalea sp.]|nr:tRNA (adenosine(37)-N6)-dimethylallyltransferase MiaA [Desulfatitalea sp.]NNJ99423.1 tRNA (adenosine(37)-N6)-dimethylallyltransferase MiaA [Desulfatitalea sp.]
GGTGLYIKSLLYGLFESRPSDPVVRQRLKSQLARQGAGAMHDLLRKRDVRAAERIHPNDSFRVLRALEVIETTGRPISEHHKAHGFQRPRYNALAIGLTRPREVLNDRINQRVDQMISQGLMDEVRCLLAQGLDPTLKSMQSLGYRHMVDFIQGRLAWQEALRTLKRDHRRYAKRQYTWFKAVPGIHWITPAQIEAAVHLVADFLGMNNGSKPTQ